MTVTEMTQVPILVDALQRDFRMACRFKRLADEDRREVERAFIRHARACKKAGIETERTFLLELMGDVKAGRHDPSMMMA